MADVEPVGKKVALLIGVGAYSDALGALRCPANGVAAMEGILSNSDIGGFDEVIPIVDPSVGEMRRQISTVFRQRAKADLVLLYFTGHGVNDMTGTFHLTTAETELFDNGDLNAGTAVDADFIKREIGNCYAERKVVILDCCFAAAFANGFIGMDDGSVDVAGQLGVDALAAKGYCVLTAATSGKYALEPKDEAEKLSVYTRYLVEGLQTGAAALEGQMTISLRHWHEYVKERVAVAAPAMEPTIFAGQQGYDIIVAKAFVDNEQRYRKLVQQKVKVGQGRLRPAAVSNLVILQQRYGVTAEQARAIQVEVLRPYEEKARHVKAYEVTLLAEKDYAFPLDAEAVEELQEQKRRLNLRDEDVAAAETRVLGSVLSVKSFSSGSRAVEARLEPAPTQSKSNPYSTFSFESVRVNEQGKEVEKASGTAEYFTEALGDGIDLEMVRIPGGKFLMGAAQGEEGASDDEYPQHEVTVPEFWVGKFAVTQAQWAAVAAMDKVERDLAKDPANFKGAQRPVEKVSWEEAVEFCKRLSQHSKRAYSLPSEAQWEYACRAGTTTPFHFGSTITTELANYGRKKGKTVDVGSFPANSFGLYDMHGNVWEWCLDGWHDSYKGAPTDGSVWESSDEKKVLRGGSWNHDPTLCRAADRFRLTRDFRNHLIGFRVVCLFAPRT